MKRSCERVAKHIKPIIPRNRVGAILMAASERAMPGGRTRVAFMGSPTTPAGLRAPDSFAQFSTGDLNAYQIGGQRRSFPGPGG